jgi:hypothetical protein
MKTTKSISSTAPRKTLIISLIGVFFTFITIGFANDIIQMGRQPTLRFGLGILLTGLFSVWYAVTGTILRKNWWKAALPIFATQFFVMGLLGNWLPDLPAPTWMGAARDRPLAKPADLRWYSHNICGGSGLHVLRLRLDRRGQTLFPRACGDGAGRRDPPRARPHHRC